ncbi:MAG: thiamine phosphate synthase [Hyphomicrobiaceae bacterium]|nr:thiamine phosphate synthase [Hyphomicrobiaceae bacterium]
MTQRLDPFYPIVPDAGWVRRIVPLGVRMVQLRLKDADAGEVRRQVRDSLEVCAAHDCLLIVNDYWEAAIELGAGYIHLGQEDLATADLAAIRKAGLKLGISTHSHEELEIALAAKPDYVALGPIYETKLKQMKWDPQGLERLADWKRRIACPLCAIGGITIERAPGVWAAGADTIAVVTDFLTHHNPDERVRAWLAWANTVRKQSY